MKKIYTDPFVAEALSKVPSFIKYDVGYSFDTAKVLHDVLKEKGWTQAEFANRLGKRESEVSKWLSGVHNFTTRTFAKISETIGEDFLNRIAMHRLNLTEGNMHTLYPKVSVSFCLSVKPKSSWASKKTKKQWNFLLPNA